MALEAVVFDLDGTLVDTEMVWDTVRRELAADAGIEWQEQFTHDMMGMSTKEWSHYLTKVVGLPTSDEEAACMTVQGMADHYERDVRILPGAQAAVRRMADEVPVAVASSSPRSLIETATEVLGIAEILAATITTEECAHGKPAPDAYLAACAALNVRPEHCVAVEDARPGILSALDAGLAVVAVPQASHMPPEDLLRRATVLGSLDELTVELVRTLS